MVVDPQREAPAAPEETANSEAAQVDSVTPPAPAAPAAPAAAPADGISQAERNRRAEEGRRAAAERAATQQRLQAIEQGQAQLLGYLQQQAVSEQQRRNQEILNAIEDPGERALKYIELQEQQRNQRTAVPLAQPAPVRQQQPQDELAYTRQRAREIIEGVNAEYGTQLTGREPEIDWNSEPAFMVSVARLATAQQSAQGPVTPTGDNVPKKPDAAAPTTDDIVKQVTEQVTAQVNRNLGISSPASPQAAGSRAAAGVPTEQDLQNTVAGYDRKRGPKETIEKLRQQREALQRAQRR